MKATYEERQIWQMSLFIAGFDAIIAIATLAGGLYWVGVLMLIAIAILLTILYVTLTKL